MKMKISIFTVMLATIAMLFMPNYSNTAYASETLGVLKPIHIYTFDNDTDTAVVDAVTKSAMNGSATGTTIIEGSNGTGKARHFDGKSYISFSDKIIPAGKKSIKFRIRKDAPPANTEYIFANISSWPKDTGTDTFIMSDGKIGFETCTSGNVVRAYSIQNICDDNWHTILFTWDGTKDTNAVKLYIDDMTTPVYTSTSTFLETNPGTYNFTIGGTALTKGDYIGDIDDIEIYDNIYCNAPNCLIATPDNDNKLIKLSWNGIPGASYKVYRSETSGKNYRPISDDQTITTNSYIDHTAVPGTTYYYVVTAVQTNTESNYSNEASATLSSGDRAILVISFNNGKEKEYDLSADEIDKFTDWYDKRSDGLGKTYFSLPKYGYVKPFNVRKEFVKFDNIESFEIKDYNSK